jgi:hypothetical protein
MKEKKAKQRERTPQECCDYLAGQQEALRRQIKTMNRDLAKLETELQAATFAAGIALTKNEKG